MVPPGAADEWDEGDAEQEHHERGDAPYGHYDVELVVGDLAMLGPMGRGVLSFVGGCGESCQGLALAPSFAAGSASRGG